MDRRPSRKQLRQLDRDNAEWPAALVKVAPEEWRSKIGGEILGTDSHHIEFFRSRDFLVQTFDAGNGIIRMSVNRTSWDQNAGSWSERIAWDDLQRLKSEAGYGDRDAVEIYPSDDSVVNVANMRHLFILPEKIAYAWRKR